jgi:peptidyl-prolyl cis-trans isomerase B (cyclophilin B)
VRRILTTILLGALSLGCGAQDTSYYSIDTPLGSMVVRLYDETPEHRDNFKKLVSEGFYEGTTFHRVIRNFMIQGGDPNSKDADPGNNGTGGPGYTLPAEFVPGLIHRRGALAAARQPDQVNPERRSNGSQFYIVQGQVFDDTMMGQMEERGLAIPEEAREVYRSEGGIPWLDGQYTVFGELVDGFDVLDRIANTATPNAEGRAVPPPIGDQPIEKVTISIRPVPDFGK